MRRTSYSAMVDVIEGRILKLAVVAQQEEQVGDGFEGIVDLVGDGGGQPAGGGELLGLAQSLFAAFAVAGVEDDDAGPAHLAAGWCAPG